MTNPQANASLYTSLGMSTLFNFYQRHKVPLNELETLEGKFEQTGESNGLPLWTPKAVRSEEEIRHFNQTLMEWLWNFRDFFWSYAAKNLGLTKHQAQAETKAVIAASQALQLCGYFRNLGSHFELDKFKDYPQFQANPPRLGEVQVHSLMANGDTAYFTNRIGAEWTAVSAQLPFIQTIAIDNLPGDKDTRRIAEEAAWQWIELLKRHGRDLGVQKPQWFETKLAIKTLAFGATPKALRHRFIELPPWIDAPPLEWDKVNTIEVLVDGQFCDLYECVRWTGLPSFQDTDRAPAMD